MGKVDKASGPPHGRGDHNGSSRSGTTRRREDQLFSGYRGVECRVCMISLSFRDLRVVVVVGGGAFLSVNQNERVMLFHSLFFASCLIPRKDSRWRKVN